MKRIGILLLLVGIFVGFATLGAEAAETYDKPIERSIGLLQRFESMSEAAALGAAIKSGKGVAIFPAVVDVAVGVGGKGGHGLVFVKDDGGKWRGPSFVSMTGLSVGLQAGAQELGIVFVINNDKGLETFLKDRSFQVGADADAVAGPWGIDVEVVDVGRDASLYTYTLDKGVFAGIGFDGTMINVSDELNKTYWNKDIRPAEALGTEAADPRVAPLIEVLQRLENK